MRILSEFFLGVAMIGAHHSFGSVTTCIIPCVTRRSISFLSSLYVNETVPGCSHRMARHCLCMHVKLLSWHGVNLPVEDHGEIFHQALFTDCQCIDCC